jgi:hypothetical protein
MEVTQLNNAITAYMGGPKYIKDKHFSHLMDVEFELIGLEDLRYHLSWDWMIPVWSKIRNELTPGMVIHAISCIDTDNLPELHTLIGNVAAQWCKNKNINL